MSGLKLNNTKKMDLIIRENGESNITRIIFYNPKGISVNYEGKPAREVLKSIYEVMTKQ